MQREPGSDSAQAAADLTEALRRAASQVMAIDDVTTGDGQKYAARFRGRLVMDSRQAYAQAAGQFRQLGFTALFRKEDERDVIYAVRGVSNPPPNRPVINLVLFGLTAVSMLVTGGSYGYTGRLETPGDWIRMSLDGWPFLLSMLGILLAHELGHYFAARYHGVAVTLPFFIPLPLVSPFGTMGAFIQLKSPPTDRRVLLDIGIAGPLAGFAVALPVLLFGLITSAPLRHIPLDQVGGFEGNSVLYVLMKYLVFGRWLPEPLSFGSLPPIVHMLRFYVTGAPVPAGGLDVFLNQVAWAGWAGLLITGLNLIPAGQLDGGHALYVLIGQRARRVWPVILVALVILGIVWTGWFLWAALIFTLGRTYAEPLDQITELDAGRKALAVLALILFVLLITPVPLT